MQITLVAYTKFLLDAAESTTGYKWDGGDPDDDDNDAGKLAVFAGRGCYESWEAPNPATATIEGYLNNIFAQEHFSVIEHGSVSLHFDGVSRSFTHELIRHRHFSYSQLSQRYAKLGDARPVMPPLFRNSDPVEEILFKAWETAVFYYGILLDRALISAEAAGYTGSMARKRAQEAARCVLPNMTPTKILVSGNHRSWMEFLLKRGGVAADLEIREAAFEVFRQLSLLEPALYANLAIHGEGNEQHMCFAAGHR